MEEVARAARISRPGLYFLFSSSDVAVVIEDNPDLIGEIIDTLRRRFEELVTDAIAIRSGREAALPVTQTMISASIGIKHQVASREDYRERLEVAVDLLLS